MMIRACIVGMVMAPETKQVVRADEIDGVRGYIPLQADQGSVAGMLVELSEAVAPYRRLQPPLT